MRLGKYGKILHYDKTSLGVGNIKRFTIFEWKSLGGIIINIFNTENQDRFHSHAFNAFSIMVRGHYYEDVIENTFINNKLNHQVVTKKIEKSRFIPKNYIHKITKSTKNAISITIEGPWDDVWSELFDNGRVKVYTWGRQVLLDNKKRETNESTDLRKE